MPQLSLIGLKMIHDAFISSENQAISKWSEQIGMVAAGSWQVIHHLFLPTRNILV